jgi:chromodomain-helicase-DNA-binding protein 4
MGPDVCKLCGVAHVSFSEKCLHFLTAVQIRVILDSLRESKQPEAQIEAAREVLRRELFMKLNAKQEKPRTRLPF